MRKDDNRPESENQTQQAVSITDEWLHDLLDWTALPSHESASHASQQSATPPLDHAEVANGTFGS